MKRFFIGFVFLLPLTGFSAVDPLTKHDKECQSISDFSKVLMEARQSGVSLDYMLTYIETVTSGDTSIDGIRVSNVSKKLAKEAYSYDIVNPSLAQSTVNNFGSSVLTDCLDGSLKY